MSLQEDAACNHASRNSPETKVWNSRDKFIHISGLSPILAKNTFILVEQFSTDEQVREPCENGLNLMGSLHPLV